MNVLPSTSENATAPAGESAPNEVAPAVALAPGKRLVAAPRDPRLFRFGMRAFLIASVLFSLQFLVWKLLGVFLGSLVNASLILLVVVGTVLWGAVAGARDGKNDRFWDQALVRGMLAFYLMGAIALLAGGGQSIALLVETQRLRYVAQERFGFSATERMAIDGKATVQLIVVTDAKPNGAFARAGVAPGQAIVVANQSTNDFYRRLLAGESASITLTLVSVAPGPTMAATDVSRLPTRTAKLDLQPPD